ncbi:hypothetical protein [Aeromonas phage Aer_P220]|uniref:Uncharacterized protein n=1 Tax=Aeromonas phage Aer_P220 TaxID=2951227 RepID=A0A9E7SYY1_9CAUD|nr:hypothetical protein [Aeromonas phage Aer_P220]
MSKVEERRKLLIGQATHTDNNGNLYKYVNQSLFRYEETRDRRELILHWSLCDYVPCTLTGELYEVR